MKDYPLDKSRQSRVCPVLMLIGGNSMLPMTKDIWREIDHAISLMNEKWLGLIGLEGE